MFDSWAVFEQAVLESNYHQSQETLEHLARRTASPSQAFALAYQAAIVHLVPLLNPKQWAAFCVSETQGNHPRQLQAQAVLNAQSQIVVSGEKTFVTHGQHVRQLIVIARSHLLEEQGRLRAYSLKKDTKGVEISESRPAGILPELDHGKLTLTEANAYQLEGDGHSDYSKRFRLLEDQYMLAVFCWHISAQLESLNITNADFSLTPDTLVDQVKIQGSLDANQLINLAALYEKFMKLSEEYLSALQGHSVIQQQWQRDSKLFLLAKKSRELRTSKARQSLSQTS
ncbi:hypothetical protein HF888_04350 [Bermanella marisrubri]|uniref:Acyl-CoA oxidase/dehydrogenase middle domain-containing protein n=2 Tax=Bermanella marisrubri TaxID=207949 RepID=Q1N1M4_9GAMM|nr:hypothetical protein RED65_03270 [Oceanobacter sp. RED65] [Bermanella marisrubri]QIZ83499.1 hypothetical protein HF888_04350 [Bermanella marisrubri]